jgi:hypothetical protein
MLKIIMRSAKRSPIEDIEVIGGKYGDPKYP